MFPIMMIISMALSIFFLFGGYYISSILAEKTLNNPLTVMCFGVSLFFYIQLILMML